MRRDAFAALLLGLALAVGCGSDSREVFDTGPTSGAPSGGGGGQFPGPSAASTGGTSTSGGAPGGGAPSAGGTPATSAGGATVGAGGVASGGTGSVDPLPSDLSHTFATLDVAPGAEITGLCQSWTVENPTNVFVNRIEATNRGGVHHSNWIWVPDNLYTGPDGTWNCADRSFDQVFAGAQGGVFFAQSTQSPTDTQQFPPGVAFEMPARVRIIGDVHLLNASADALQTDIHFDVYTIPAEAVRVPLQPMAFTNLALDIAPVSQTEAHMQCATPQPDFDVYYVLPHYHALGTSMRIDVAGGPMDGTPVFESQPSYGEPWGVTYDPPFSVTGATGLGISCFYDNPRSATVGYGTGDQEMCVTLIYTSGRKAGGMANVNLSVGDVGGLHQTDGLCLSVGQ